MVKQVLMAGLAVVGLAMAGTSAQAQGVIVAPGPAYVQYYSPYTASYYYPNSGYVYGYPYSYVYSNTYVGRTVYGPGYTANYPYMYNQLNYGRTYPNYGSYYYPGYTTYRTYRWR